MQDNWLDKLSALKQSMPQEPDTQEQESTTEDIAEAPAQSGRLDIVYERKGRAGKCATSITGFTLSDSEVEKLASELKRRLGTGGSARGGEILVQGDRRRDVLEFLVSKGYKARII